MISARQDYFEHVQGHVERGDTVGGDNITAKINGDVKHLAIGKDIQQQSTERSNDVIDINQLQTKEDLQTHYQLLSEKLSVFRKDYILEHDTAAKFKLKKNIEEAEADLNTIEQRLEALE